MATYRLFIQKRHQRRKRGADQATFSLLFTVVDLDRGTFPFNYICDLPKYFRDTKYSQFFIEPTTGLLTAKSLLDKAKEEYTDPTIQQEIDARISRIKQSIEAMSQKQEVELSY